MVEKIKKLVRIESYLYPGIYVVSLIILLFVVGRIYKVKDQVVESRNKVAVLDNDIDRLDKIIKVRDENENKFAALNNSLPRTYRDVAGFTVEVEKIAQDQAETLEVTIDKTAKNETNFNSLKFSITTRGSFTSIKNTISQFADLPYHTSVDSLKVQSDAGGLVTLTNFRLLMQKP